MARRIGHGGGCCGIRHLYSFRGNERAYELRRETRDADAGGFMMEVVITNGQRRRNPTLHTNLLEVGFREVTSFRNGNSGNTCNVYHYHPNPTYHNVDITSLNPYPRLSKWQRFKNWFNN